MNRIVIIVGTVLMVLTPFFVQAQLLDPVTYSIKESPDTVKSAEIFNVLVEAEIEGDWHLYSALNDPDAGPYPTTFKPANNGMKIAGAVTETEARIVLDPNFNAELGWHSSRAEFAVPVVFSDELQGPQNIEIDILYQVCDDVSCLPPKTKTVSAPVYLSGFSDNPYTSFDDSDADYIKNPPVIINYLIIGGVIALIIFFRYIQVKIRERSSADNK